MMRGRRADGRAALRGVRRAPEGPSSGGDARLVTIAPWLLTTLRARIHGGHPKGPSSGRGSRARLQSSRQCPCRWSRRTSQRSACGRRRGRGACQRSRPVLWPFFLFLCRLIHGHRRRRVLLPFSLHLRRLLQGVCLIHGSSVGVRVAGRDVLPSGHRGGWRGNVGLRRDLALHHVHEDDLLVGGSNFLLLLGRCGHLDIDLRRCDGRVGYVLSESAIVFAIAIAIASWHLADVA
mmetsp:Transcript_10020/g.29617  ORF Transcript_10020/g.29617 Transcript_10020/m.29617 type:complete len:235 (-) Transcript_10020:1207-1911(-)